MWLCLRLSIVQHTKVRVYLDIFAPLDARIVEYNFLDFRQAEMTDDESKLAFLDITLFCLA